MKYLLIILLLFSCHKESGEYTNMIIYTSGSQEIYSLKIQNLSIGQGSDKSYSVGNKLDLTYYVGDIISFKFKSKKPFRVKIVMTSKVYYERVDSLHNLEVTIK